MKIEPAFERLQSGEVNSRVLRVVTNGEAEGKTVRLGFITPMGKIYISSELDLSEGISDYTLPDGLLDGKGMLLAQILINAADGYSLKSKVYEFPVYSSVDDKESPAVSDSALLSLSVLKELIDTKSDKEHDHDERYYTKGIADSLLSMKSDVRHEHTGTYLTASEILELVSGISAASHTHDDRYYTQTEIADFLSGKSNTSHVHSYESLTGKPLINGKTVEGNMDVNGLLFRRILTSADDCDNIKDDGVYAYSTASAPKNAPFANASVITVFGNPENRTQKIQTAYRYGTTGQSAFRPLYDGNYLEWAKCVDNIAEEGTSGSWYYRKWQSGRSEAWGIVDLTVTDKSNVPSVSGMQVLNAEIKFPSAVLSNNTKAVECHFLQPKDYRFISSTASVSNNILWGRFYTYTAFADSFTVDSSTLKASAFLVGKWK